MNKPEFDPTTVKGLNVEAFEQWLGYKRGKKQTYKTVITLRAAADKLASFGDEEAQQAAVTQSISNNWSGLFAVTPKKLAPGEKRTKTREQKAADDFNWENSVKRAEKNWQEIVPTPYGRLRLCDALWARYTIEEGPDIADKMDWLKGVVARNLKEVEAKLVVGDPHLMIMVMCFFGPLGVKRIKERAAVGA